MFGFGFYLVFYVGYPILDPDAVASRQWPKTEGEVVVSEIATSRSGAAGPWMYEGRVRYAYQVADQRYESEVIELHGASGRQMSTSRSAAQRDLRDYKKGSKVAVYYDPADPARACLNPGVRPAIGLVLVGLLLFVGGAVAAYTAFEKIKAIFGR